MRAVEVVTFIVVRCGFCYVGVCVCVGLVAMCSLSVWCWYCCVLPHCALTMRVNWFSGFVC